MIFHNWDMHPSPTDVGGKQEGMQLLLNPNPVPLLLQDLGGGMQTQDGKKKVQDYPTETQVQEAAVRFLRLLFLQQ